MTTELTYDNYLAHYGIKGMKWGVRRKPGPDGLVSTNEGKKKEGYVSRVKGRYNKDRTRELRSVTVTSKRGEKVVAKEDGNVKFASFISSLSEKNFKKTIDEPSFSIEVDGKKVGESSFAKKENGEINLVWLGIDSEHRGQGYASAVFDAAVEYGRSEGSNKLTLEVPGNAPDARHIYEKRGFKVTKEPTEKEKKEDFLWGGLTHMALDLNNPSLNHADSDDLELEKAFEQTFEKLPKDVEESVFPSSTDAEHGNLTYENYLEHYGVKGMRWGVRRKTGPDGTVTGEVASKNKSKMAKPTRKEKREERRKLNAPNKNYTSFQRSNDSLLYGGHGVKRVNRDMNRGDSHREAVDKEKKYQKKALATKVALVTALYFSPEIANVAVKGYSGLHNAAYEKKSQRNKAEAGRKAANAFSDSRGISNFRVIDLDFDSKENIWR